jgi:hypothetical protein
MVLEIVDLNAQSIDDLKRREQIWIWLCNSHRRGYNQTRGGEGTIGFRHSSETKEKLSELRKGTKLTEEHKAKLSWKGRKHRPETKAKIARAHRGRPMPETAKRKLSERKKGIPHTPEDIEKIRLAMQAFKGIPIPEERRLRIKQGNIRHFYELISPEGARFETRDLETFAKKHNLSTKHLGAVARRERNNHQGWQCRFLKYDGTVEGADQFYKDHSVEPLVREDALPVACCKYLNFLKSPPPERKRYIAMNVSEFARTNPDFGLQAGGLQRLLRGERRSYKEWVGERFERRIGWVMLAPECNYDRCELADVCGVTIAVLDQCFIADFGVAASDWLQERRRIESG